jgi:hypothetical protein
MIRIRFGNAYSGGENDLQCFPKADRGVLSRCAILAAKPVSDLRLSPGLISREVHAMPIAKYFIPANFCRCLDYNSFAALAGASS